MSTSFREKQVSYDNPCAPIVSFSSRNQIEQFDDEEQDMTDDRTNELTLGKYRERCSCSSSARWHLVDLLSRRTFIQNDVPRRSCQLIRQHNQRLLFRSGTTTDRRSITRSSRFRQVRPIDYSFQLIVSFCFSLTSVWSDLISNLRTSLRHDLKLPQIAEQCQRTMKKLRPAKFDDEEILSIDHADADEEEEEDELREKLDMHSVILSTDHLHLEPFLTAEQVISEIDFMLQDMTPDSGYCDDHSTADLLDFHSRRLDCLHPDASDEKEKKTQSIDSLNESIEELNRSIKDLSSILVQELAMRDELDYEKETKNTFISLVLSIQVRHSLIPASFLPFMHSFGLCRINGSNTKLKSGRNVVLCSCRWATRWNRER